MPDTSLQPPPAPTGIADPAEPIVWLGMTQAELDAAYDQIRYAPNQPQILKRFASNSEDWRQRAGAPRRLAYGPAAVEQLDLYPAAGAGAPIHIFIHGGAWRSGVARDYGFLAEMFVNAGAHFVVPDFSWVQDVNGSLLPIADQLRRAVAWVHAHAADFGGDPARIHLSGHSSGSHLAAVLLTTDWAEGFGLPANVLKSGLCSSGVFELTPVGLSSRRAYLKLTTEMVQALSPQRHLEQIRAPLVIAFGSLETPEFRRQSSEFAAAVAAAGKPVQLLTAEGYNHFEIVETLASPYGLLGRAALAQMQLPAPG
ncbi:MAG: alpha/beta hydrolase [Polaromonas sp.]|nr:alpha/beta hydrolase [Polaromonas sp.]